MRKLFSRQLVEARHEMLSIYEAVDVAPLDAAYAYVSGARNLAAEPRARAAPTWRPSATT